MVALTWLVLWPLPREGGPSDDCDKPFPNVQPELLLTQLHSICLCPVACQQREISTCLPTVPLYEVVDCDEVRSWRYSQSPEQKQTIPITKGSCSFLSRSHWPDPVAISFLRINNFPVTKEGKQEVVRPWTHYTNVFISPQLKHLIHREANHLPTKQPFLTRLQISLLLSSHMMFFP